MAAEVVIALLLTGAGVCWCAVAAPEVPALARAAVRRLDEALEVDRVAVDLAQAELRWLPARWWIVLRWTLSALAGMAGFLLLGLLVPGVVAALVAYHLAGFGLESRRRGIEARRQRALLDAARFGVSVMSRAGGALQMLRALAETGPGDARPVFRELLADAGSEQPDLLLGAVRRTREKLADPLFDDLAIALMVHWRRGARLAPALEVVVEHWGETLRLQREAKALRAGMDASVLLLTLLPFVFLLLIHVETPALLRPLGTPAGEVVLALSAAWMVLGHRVLQALSEAPREERIRFDEEAL